MDLGLGGRRYLVTGGTSGLGLAAAQVLVDAGASVLVSSRSREHVDEAVSSLGERAAGAVGDLTDPDTPEHLVAVAQERLGGLDGAFVSYGGPPTGGASDLDDGALSASVEQALLAPVRVVRDVAAALGDGGAIVLVTSSSNEQPIPGLAGSNLTRPGLWGYVKTLADEIGPRGVRVNALIPGRYATDRVVELEETIAEREDISREQVRADAEAAIPLRRLGRPRELGRIAAFLLSPAASYVTGAAWRADGGMIRGL